MPSSSTQSLLPILLLLLLANLANLGGAASSTPPIDSSTSPTSTITKPPRKSPRDARVYVHRVLSNGLPVLLVSDPVANRAAACMSVGVGYYSDPPEIPGLAHFLEHMLFNGNRKYPLEGAFDDFLSTHRGSTNAETGEETTNFYFDVSLTNY